MLQFSVIMKKNNPKKKLSQIIIIVIGIILIVSFLIKSYRGNQVVLAPTDKSQENSVLVGNLYRNTKYNFRIKFPNGWEITDGDGPNIVQKAMKNNRSINIGIRDFSSGVDSDLSINDIYSTKEIEDEIISSYGKDTNVLESGETYLDNKPVLWVKYSTSYSALNLTVEVTNTQYYLLHNKVLYVITAGTSTDDFNNAEEELKQSVLTFVIEDYPNQNSEINEENNTTWSEYYLDQDKYKVSLPTKPNENNKSITVRNILMPYVEYYSSEDNTYYYVSYVDVEALYKKELQVIKDSDEYKNNTFTQQLIADRRGVEYPTLLDFYDELFQNNVGFREIEKIKNHFNDFYTIDYLWKDTNSDKFIKGKIILVNGKDIYLLSTENESNNFPNSESFVYSWKSFGDLSN